MLRGTTTDFYEADGLGSITSLTNPFRYTGREFDAETSLYYYRARYYDPQEGRFINEDPLEFGGGSNFYTYGLNDPADVNDAYGLCPKCDADGYRDATPEEGKKILQKALSYQGTPYKWNGKTPEGFDCSGFVCYVLKNSANPNLPNSAANNLPANPGLRPLSPAQPPQAGDVLLIPGQPGHHGHSGFYDPNPALPGQNLPSPRGDKDRPTPGVSPGKPGWWPGAPQYFRPRVPC